RHRLFALRVDARIDRVEDAADQDRPPYDLLAELGRQRLDVVESEIGPGTGTVEEEFDHGCFLGCRLLLISSFRGARSASPESISHVALGPNGSGARASRRPGMTAERETSPFPSTSLAICPNITRRVSSLKGSLTNLPIAKPACTCGRARTSAYQRLTFG